MKLKPSARHRQRGVAVLVLLVLLVLIGAFMAANQVTLRSLHRELELLEHQQARKYGALAVMPAPAPTARTNVITSATQNPTPAPAGPNP